MAIGLSPVAEAGAATLSVTLALAPGAIDSVDAAKLVVQPLGGAACSAKLEVPQAALSLLVSVKP